MMRKLLFLLGVVALASSAPAQSGNDLNEGSQITHDAFNGTFNFSWWGRAGNTYFIQHSDDLMTWEYVPIIESGAGETIEWGFASSAEKFFLRLRHTDEPTTDPALADFDGDGVGNMAELDQGTDPLDYYNGIVPTFVKLAGDGQTVQTDSLAPRAFELLVLNANGQGLPNAPVEFVITSGGSLAEDSVPGSPLTALLRVRADYSGRVRPPTGSVFFRAASSSGLAAVQASGGGATAQFSVSVTAEGPLAPPADFSALTNADGSMQFQWTLPASGVPDGASIVLLGRGADGQWQTITTLGASATSFSASPQQVSLFTDFALRIDSGPNSSPLSNVVGPSARPAYAVIDLGEGTPLGVASDGTVVIRRNFTTETSPYRHRAGVDELLGYSGEHFFFNDMNDAGDIVGVADGDQEGLTAYAIFANNAASSLTRWAQGGQYAPGFLASYLERINEKRTTVGGEHGSQVNGSIESGWSRNFISAAPLNLQTIASSTYSRHIYEDPNYPSTSSGTSFEIRDLNNHGGGVGMQRNHVTNAETPLYLRKAPQPSGDSSFEPYATNDDGLVLGRSSGTLKLWEPLAGAFRTLSLPNFVADEDPLRVTDPPASEPYAPTFILAGNNLIIRTWTDADGVPSPFPIHTTVGAGEFLPAGSPYSNLSLKAVSNNGLIVATADKQGEELTRAVLLLALEFKARDGRINYGFDPPMKGLPNATPPVPDDPSSEPAWASAVSESTSDNVKLVLPASFAPNIKLSLVAGDQYLDFTPEDTALSSAETTLTLSGLSATLTGPVTAEIEARLVGNSEKVGSLKVLVLPERTVSVGIYRVTDPDSPATSPVNGPTDTEIINTLNDIYKQAGVKFSLQGSGPLEVPYDIHGPSLSDPRDGRVQEDELDTIFSAVDDEAGAVKVILAKESGIPYDDDPLTNIRAGTRNNLSVLFAKTISDSGGEIAFIEAHEMGHALTLPAANIDSSGHDLGPAPSGTGRLMGSGSRHPTSGILPANPPGRWLPREDWGRANVKANDYQ